MAWFENDPGAVNVRGGILGPMTGSQKAAMLFAGLRDAVGNFSGRPTENLNQLAEQYGQQNYRQQVRQDRLDDKDATRKAEQDRREWELKNRAPNLTTAINPETNQMGQFYLDAETRLPVWVKGVKLPGEAPKTRTKRVGMQDVMEEYDPIKMQWKEVGRGAAFKPDAPPASGDEAPHLTDPAMVNAAVRYNLTGTLPPLGQGKTATAARGSILDLAAKLASGKYTPEQLVSQAANFKANQGSLNQQTRVFNAIETSGNAAKNSARLALQAAKAGGSGPTGIPLFNKFVQAGRRNMGDKNVMALEGHLSTFAEEYAKVMTASTGSAAATDSARAEAHKRLSSANNIDQLQHLVGEMEKEMGGRHYAARSQIKSTQGVMGGSPYSEPDGVQQPQGAEAPAPAPAAAPQGHVRTYNPKTGRLE